MFLSTTLIQSIRKEPYNLSLLSQLNNQKYLALTEAVKKGLWLKQLMKDLGINQSIVKIYYDNKSTIHLSKNTQFHSRTKHIDIKFHFVRERIETREIKVLKVHTLDNIADMLTKHILKLKLQKCFELW